VSKMRQLIDIDLFPSNAVIQYQYSHNHNDVRPVPQKTLSKLAWGETFAQRALSNACLKSNPQEMLELYVGTDTKAQRLAFLMAKGRWFTSVPASWDAVVAVSMREGDEDGVPVPNWVGVSLPSAEVPWRAPHVDLVDREVECGIIDVEGKRSEPGMAYSGYGNMSGEEWHGLRAGSTSVEGESEESEDNEEA
jgi:hypothetical protein